MIGRWHHLLMGSAVSLIVVLITAAFSGWPIWQSMPEDHALVRLSFTQSGVRSCRDRTPEELAALARNMRQLKICDRRRAPVYVEMEVDGEMVFAANLPPGGLSGSGPSRVYQRFELQAGSYDFALRLRDDPALEGFTSTLSQRIRLAPAQNLAIDYNEETGGFIFHK